MIGWPAFWTCLWRSLPRPGGTAVHWGRGRVLAVFVAFIPCCLLALLHWIGFVIDEVLFPGYRKIHVKQPLFMVGPPRCGTTFLHRLLSKDTERFTAITLGEMIFAPSITERKIFAAFVALDRALGRPVPRLVRVFERVVFGPHARMHKVSFFEPEEDYVLLSYIFACHMLIAPFPFRDVLGHLYAFDWETPPEDRDRVMRFYKQCVRRHLYVHGPGKTYLSKNPYFSPMVNSLDEHFPDATFLTNLRTPYEAVPSYFSLWNFMYGGVFQNRPDDPLAKDFMLDFLQMAYRYPVECFDAWPATKSVAVQYTDLITTPQATVQQVYDRFGWSLSPSYRKVLEQAQAAAGQFQSGHSYSLDLVGLEEADISARFR